MPTRSLDLERYDIPTVIIVSIYVMTIVIIWLYKNYTRELTQEEHDECNDIITAFHDNPDFDDFMVIYNRRTKLIAKGGRPIKYFIWGVYLDYPEFFNEARKREVESYTKDINRGLRNIKNNKITAELMDCIWQLYFATGDPKYPDIIKNIATNHPDNRISAAATWSYISIMGKDPSDTDVGAMMYGRQPINLWNDTNIQPRDLPPWHAEQQRPMYAPPEQQRPMYAPPEQQRPMYAPPEQQRPMYAPLNNQLELL